MLPALVLEVGAAEVDGLMVFNGSLVGLYGGGRTVVAKEVAWQGRRLGVPLQRPPRWRRAQRATTVTS
jgi:hypothetical protein